MKSRISNKIKARMIIESGMKYIKKNLSGTIIKLGDVNKAIKDYESGRTRYTNKDIENLNKMFNRSRLRSGAYETVKIKHDRILTKTNIYAIPHESEIIVGTKSESKNTKAKNFAKKINDMLRGWTDDGEYSDYIKDTEIFPAISKLPSNIRVNGMDIVNGKAPINIKNVKAENFDDLKQLMSSIGEIEKISTSANDALYDYFKLSEDLAGVKIPNNIDKVELYTTLKLNFERNQYGSEEERQLSIQLYEEVLKMNTSQQAEAWRVYATVNGFDEIKTAIRKAGRAL